MAALEKVVELGGESIGPNADGLLSWRAVQVAKRRSAFGGSAT
jgi:hypothetical protein